MNYTILLKYEIMAVLYNHKQNVEKLPKWRKHLNYRYSKITVISRIYSNGHCGHINVTVNQANYWPKWPKLDPNDRSIVGLTVIDVQNHLTKWLLWFPKMIVSSILRKNLIRKLTKITVITPKSPSKSLINPRGTHILDENDQYLITTWPCLTVIRLQVHNI